MGHGGTGHGGASCVEKVGAEASWLEMVTREAEAGRPELVATATDAGRN